VARPAARNLANASFVTGNTAPESGIVPAPNVKIDLVAQPVSNVPGRLQVGSADPRRKHAIPE